MSILTLKGNPSGTGTFTVESPNSNNTRTITLPDATTTLVGVDTTQTLTNKTINGGAITLGTAQVSTSGTAIDFIGIPSWVKKITVMFSLVSTNGTGNWAINGGSGSFEFTGYSSVVSNQAGTTTGSTGNFIITNTVVANATYAGHAILTQISGNTWVCSSILSDTQNNTVRYSSGVKSFGGVLDRIRVTTGAGVDTFDSGTINIMYEG